MRIHLKDDFAEAWQLTLTEINWLFILSLFNLLVRFMPEEVMALGPRVWNIIILLTNLALFFFFLLDVRYAITRSDWRNAWEGMRYYGLRYVVVALLIGGIGLTKGKLLAPLIFAYSIPSLLVEDVGIFQALWRGFVFIAKNVVEHILLLAALAGLGFLLTLAASALGLLGGLVLGLYSAFSVIVFFVFYANRLPRMPEPGPRRGILW